MEATALVSLKALSSDPAQPGEAIFIVFMNIAVPLFCLGLGYWVALARPYDPNAWLILLLLSFPEAFISVSTYNWWPRIWIPLRVFWHLTMNVLAPAPLLFLGLLFPERSRIDLKVSWFKWLLLTTLLCILAVATADDYSAWYAFGIIPNVTAVDRMLDKVANRIDLLCIAIYCVAIIDKLRSASSPDSQTQAARPLRRVRCGVRQSADHLRCAAHVLFRTRAAFSGSAIWARS
jgi:sigma-B regulation protein RsbU (phosphoserine phosphatase)